MKRDDQHLPPIPEKLYFTIGETSELCGVKPHVLRYWEQEFSQLTPTKRRGRRYYQKKDVLLVRGIKQLLHREGFTISGAKQQLANNNAVFVQKADFIKAPKNTIAQESSVLNESTSGLCKDDEHLNIFISELEKILELMKS